MFYFESLTCVLESGRSQGSVPFRRNSAIFALSLWARTTVRGIHSSVSSVAYPNIRPCERCSQQITPWIGVKITSQALLPPHVWLQLPCRGVKHKCMNPNLVTSSHVLLFSIQVNPLSDVMGLLLQSHQHIAGLIVKSCRTRQPSSSEPFHRSVLTRAENLWESYDSIQNRCSIQNRFFIE